MPKWFVAIVLVVAALIATTRVGEGQGAMVIARWSGVTVNAGRVPVLADINNGSAVDASNRAQIVGCVANDADATSCYPIFIGGQASTAIPTAVSADGDSVRAWFTRTGALHTHSTFGTSTLSNTNDAASSTALVAANTARLGVECFNDSTELLYLNYGGTATATAFTEQVQPQALWRMEPPIYTGVLNGLWAVNGSGAARCTEFTQ